MGCCKFFKEKNDFIEFIISAGGSGTGKGEEVLRGPEEPVHLEDPKQLGQLPAPNRGVGEVSDGLDDSSRE